MVFGIITLLTSFLIAGVAAYFSIAGLIAIFSGATLAVAVMAGSLELGKLVTASWLYRNWDRTGWILKIYLSIAVFVLMIITSMGIFGYLSKAHMQQGTVSSDVEARVLIIDEKIKTERENIELSRNALNQLNAQVDARLSRSDDEKGAERAIQIRKQQTRERSALQKDIETAQAKIEKLNEERAPIATELRKVESEVGPIKYVAALIYGDNPDANLLERAVRWMIILLVTVFDPLAVALLIAANQTLGRHGINLEKDKTPGNNDGSKINKSPGPSDDDTKPTSEAGTVGQNEDLQNTTQPPSSGDSLLLQQSGPTSDQPSEDNKPSGVEETTGQKKRSQSSKKKSNVSKKKIKPNQKKSLKRS